MQNFRREVALLALPAMALLAVILCHLIHANAATTTWITAAATAAGTVVVTALAVPRHPQLIGGAVIVLLTILGHYWWKVSPDLQSQLVVVVSLLFGMPLSNRITPVFPPAPPAA